MPTQRPGCASPPATPRETRPSSPNKEGLSMDAPRRTSLRTVRPCPLGTVPCPAASADAPSTAGGSTPRFNWREFITAGSAGQGQANRRGSSMPHHGLASQGGPVQRGAVENAHHRAAKVVAESKITSPTSPKRIGIFDAPGVWRWQPANCYQGGGGQTPEILHLRERTRTRAGRAQAGDPTHTPRGFNIRDHGGGPGIHGLATEPAQGKGISSQPVHRRPPQRPAQRPSPEPQ